MKLKAKINLKSKYRFNFRFILKFKRKLYHQFSLNSNLSFAVVPRKINKIIFKSIVSHLRSNNKSLRILNPRKKS